MKIKWNLVVPGGVLVGLLFFVVARNAFWFPGSSENSKVVGQDSVETLIGVFDPQNGLREKPVSGLRHVAIRLEPAAPQSALSDFSTLSSSSTPLLLTVHLSDALLGNCLEKTVKGDYDDAIKSLCSVLAKGKHPVFLRWCPDMEVPIHRFPWQYQSPLTYRYAFQRVSKLCKSLAPAVQLVWGPAGYPGSDEYWPDDSAVDVVCVTLDGQSELMTTAYPRSRDYAESIRRKIHRLRYMDKPILILGSDRVKAAVDQKDQFGTALRAIQRDGNTIFRTVGAIRVPDSTAAQSPEEVQIGVYDPKKRLISAGPVQTEHLFIDLESIQTGTFQEDLRAVLDRKHDVILTIEPWRDRKVRKDSSVLRNVINGIYDEEFQEIYQAISTTSQTVYLRFAHEMEIPIHRYAWQSQDPVLYIKAFRYFMQFGNSRSPNIKKVWGPAGDRGSMEWWPGDDVVDFISVAVYGLPDKNITDPNQQESFGTIYNRKFYRMRFSNKPIFITEFGVKGPEAYQQNWLNNAAEVIKDHPEIKGVCYFNLADNPKVWGDVPAPDWSISRKTFLEFAQRLGKKTD